MPQTSIFSAVSAMCRLIENDIVVLQAFMADLLVPYIGVARGALGAIVPPKSPRLTGHLPSQDAFWALSASKMQIFPGLCARPRWGSLQRSLRPPSWIYGYTVGLTFQSPKSYSYT